MANEPLTAGPSTFPKRLMDSLGGRYDPTMRRSVQTVVLYEAHRCLRDRLAALRPFQRKIALFDTSCDIVSTLDFIPQYHRNEIMYRTQSGKLPLSPDLAWRRMKLIDREVQKNIVPQVRPFVQPDKTHKQSCDEFIQHQYELVTGTKDKPHPTLWEHSHLNVFLAYRMFYKGDNVDPDLPPARPPREVVVPNKKPPSGVSRRSASLRDEDDDSESGLKSFMEQMAKGSNDLLADAEERRKMLDEVKTHMELLREFEGVIPEEDLERRKRELFNALPPAPLPLTTPARGKRSSRGDNGGSAKGKRVKVEPPPEESDDEEADD